MYMLFPLLFPLRFSDHWGRGGGKIVKAKCSEIQPLAAELLVSGGSCKGRDSLLEQCNYPRLVRLCYTHTHTVSTEQTPGLKQEHMKLEGRCCR